MKNVPLVSTAIMVIGLVVAIIISTRMMDERAKMYKDTPARLEATFLPMLGMDKFYAGVQWISLLQQMGDPDTKMKEDAEGQNVAKYFYEQLDDITDHNPDANKIYTVGAMHISNVQPQLAIELLVKGDDLSSKKDWHRPHIAAFIWDRFVAARTQSKDEKDKALEKARDSYRKALDMGGTPTHVETAWLRKCAELGGFSDDPLRMLKAEKDYLDSKLEAMAETMEEGPDGAQPEDVQPDASALMGSMGDSRIEGIRERVMERCQKLALDKYESLKKNPGNKDDAKALKEIKKIFFEVAPAGHYSKVSLRPYEPGYFYDVTTGTPVKPYGISYAAWDKYKQIVPLSGTYCHVTGMAREESEKKWEEWWVANKPAEK